jgi:hypothetical protein
MSSTATVLASHLGDAPDVQRALDEAWDGAWSRVDPCLLELCRLQIASILRSSSEFTARTPLAVTAGFDERKAAILGSAWNSPLFTDVERACLAFTDAFVMDVAALSDEVAGAVAAHLGDAGLVDFTSALLILEQRQRLALAWTTLFTEAPQ